MNCKECSPKRIIAIKIFPVKDKMNRQSPSLTVKILIAKRNARAARQRYAWQKALPIIYRACPLKSKYIKRL